MMPERIRRREAGEEGLMAKLSRDSSGRTHVKWTIYRYMFFFLCSCIVCVILHCIVWTFSNKRDACQIKDKAFPPERSGGWPRTQAPCWCGERHTASDALICIDILG